MVSEVMKNVIRDLVSDAVGGSGITVMSIPFITDVNEVLKAVCSIGGLVLVVVSIAYKVALYKELKKNETKNKPKRKWKT